MREAARRAWAVLTGRPTRREQQLKRDVELWRRRANFYKERWFAAAIDDHDDRGRSHA